MHIMVNKRYMRKCDTCVGHEARINKLLLKEPPGIMSANSASIVCERGANEPLKGCKRKRREKERNERQLMCKKWIEEGDEHRVRR